MHLRVLVFYLCVYPPIEGLLFVLRTRQEILVQPCTPPFRLLAF